MTTTITFTHDEGLDIHELLCLAIHEGNQDALTTLANGVDDIE